MVRATAAQPAQQNSRSAPSSAARGPPSAGWPQWKQALS
jgi:hypothetical protein